MRLSMEWHYKTSKGQQMILKSDALPAAHVYTLAEDMQNTGRVENLILTDEFDSTWTLKQLKQYLKEMETEPHNVTIYFDGGYAHQVKESGLGIVIYYEQSGAKYRYRKNAFDSYLHSNNEAEYAALYLAMTELEILGVHHQEVEIYGDSQVVINEMLDEWAIGDPEHERWVGKVEQKLQQLGIRATFARIDRKRNSEAHQLAQQALDGVNIEAKMKR